MKDLKSYILESKSKKKTDPKIGNIKYTIWKEPKVKVKWLENNDYNFQKIEYKYITDKISIDFLLGWDQNEKTWKLWIGKVGVTTYDDDPYTDLETELFSEAVVSSLEKISEFIDKVEKDDPKNWVQFYIDA